MCANHFLGQTKARRAEEYYFCTRAPSYLTLLPPPLKLNLLEDLNPPLVSVSAFRKMKIYTFVLGVINSPAFTQQIPAIALKYVFTLPIFLCIQMSAISLASQGKKENGRLPNQPNGKQN